jgi:ABC-type nitrate/sulfonate/bicarbonate transport system permease component
MLKKIIPPALLVVALGIGWEIWAVKGHLGSDVLPSPVQVWQQGWANRGLLWTSTLPTLRETMIGFALSLAIGFVLSVLVDASGTLRRAFMPVLVISQTLPLVAIAPVLVLLLGFGLFPKVLIVILVTFFPITVGLVEGYAATEPEAETLLRTMGAGRWRIFRSLRLPTALPYFFAALRIAVTYAVVAAIFSEYSGAISGLGILMQNAKNDFQTALMLAAVVVSALLTLALFGLTFLVQRVTAPWIHLQRRRLTS